MKSYYVFKQIGQSIKLVGKSKDEFHSFIRNNYDDVIEWQANEIEESLNLGDIQEDSPLVVECLDNENQWVLCYPDSDSIIYTQKNFDNSDHLSIQFDNCLIYFKEEKLLNNVEKKLIG
jgi:hypothetical protein